MGQRLWPTKLLELSEEEWQAQFSRLVKPVQPLSLQGELERGENVDRQRVDFGSAFSLRTPERRCLRSLLPGFWLHQAVV